MRRAPLCIARSSTEDPSEVEVLANYDTAYGSIEVASERWRLSGNLGRAKAFDEAVTSAFACTPSRLGESKIVALRASLEGLEEALVGTLTDDRHLLTREQIEELRNVSKTLSFDESYGADAREAVLDALVHVHHLRDILDEALASQAFD